MITCHLRYEIDPGKVEAFEAYVTGWIPVVTRFGGTHHGCYLPHEGASDIAYALFSFPSLAAYENYRTAIRQDTQALELWRLSKESACIRRFDRTFLRPAPDPSRSTEALGRLASCGSAGGPGRSLAGLSMTQTGGDSCPSTAVPTIRARGPAGTAG